MEYENHGGKYLRYFLGSIFIWLLVVGLVNITVDPFAMFRLVAIDGFNAEKTEYGKYVRMAKAHAIRINKPRGIILGSSRAEYAIDPEHPGWSESSQPVYNLALPSGSIYEALRYLQHAQSINDIGQAVLVLDMFMFNTNMQKAEGFNDYRLASADDTSIDAGWLRDIITSTISLDALWSSIKTVLSQNKPDHVPYQRNGMRDPVKNWNKISLKGGHRAAFISNEHHSLTAPDGWALFSLDNKQNKLQPTIETFSDLIRFCRKNDIQLYVLISPVHARKLEIIWQLGLWGVFEEWKRALASVLYADAVQHTQSESYPLWDFSGYHGISTEAVPPIKDTTTRMRWYWEGSHYRKEVGDLMLNRIFGNDDSYVQQGGNVFGVQLIPDNIENHLERLRNDRAEYAASNSKEINEISLMVRETASTRESLIVDYSK